MLSEKAIAIGHWVDRLPPRQAILLACGILVATSSLDYVSGIEISLGIFYLLPVIIVGWRGSMSAAMIISVLAALTMEGLYLLDGDRYSSTWVYIWNPISRFLSYAVISYLLQRLRHSMERLEALSRVDSLTGLSNHGAFLSALQDEINRQQRTRHSLSLAFVDLDHFKELNDKFGHLAGDRALKAVARILRNRLRKTDVIGRLGGDEFAILMPETDGAGAVAALKFVRHKMLDAMNRQNFPVTFSMGVVTSRGDASPTRLLQQADSLMYEVKRQGRNDIRHSDLSLP